MDARERTHDGHGAARLGWLRGHLAVDGDANLRPRDTPLAHAAGARVLVVPPPPWRPGQPGHAAFRERYRLRPTTVWLGTADAMLHGFDAVTGVELAAYLPRTMLRPAGAAATRDGQMAAPSCPRPESVDASLSGVWHTLLLCALGWPRTGVDRSGAHPAGAQGNAAAGVFVLDVSSVTGPLPIRLVWEVAASRDLPLAPAGPVRAAMLDDAGQPRWYAIVPTMAAGEAPEDAPTPPSLALLPLDKPSAADWNGRYAIRQLRLPAGGCDDATPAPLVALTVGTRADGMATAAYAVDARSRLWRMGLARALTPDAGPQIACLHHLSAPARAEMAEAPALLAIPAGTLVVYGAGNRIAAVPDTGKDRQAPARRIRAERTGDGFVLGAASAPEADASGKVGANVGAGVGADVGANAGWTLELPRPGEALQQLLPDASGLLGFVTRTPDDKLHAYLVHAVSGESRLAPAAGQAAALTVTGRTAGPAADNGIALLRLQAPAPMPPAPGTTSRETQDVSLWSIRGASAHPLAHAMATRRTGRLVWRELVEPEAP